MIYNPQETLPATQSMRRHLRDPSPMRPEAAPKGALQTERRYLPGPASMGPAAAPTRAPPHETREGPAATSQTGRQRDRKGGGDFSSTIVSFLVRSIAELSLFQTELIKYHIDKNSPVKCSRAIRTNSNCVCKVNNNKNST